MGICWFLDFCLGFFISRWSCHNRTLDSCYELGTLAISCSSSVNNFFTWLAFRMDRNINYFCSNFLPMLDAFGVNPYFFAMLVALNLQTSFLTPPMAMAAYYLKGVVGDEIELIEIFKSIMPYLAIVIFTMVLMYNFPGIALYLPDYFFGIAK